MASGHGETVRKKRTRGFDLHADNLAEVEAHRMKWESQLEEFHAKQGVNSQIFSAEKINYIISLLLNSDSIPWPVILDCTYRPL